MSLKYIFLLFLDYHTKLLYYDMQILL